MTTEEYEALFPNRPRDSVIVPGHQQHNAEGPIGTARAILWKPEHGEPEWIPRSHVFKDAANAILITTWMAKQKGWDDPKAMAAKAEDQMYSQVKRPANSGLFEPDEDDEIPF